MMPIGPLMIEHRLIERMIYLIGAEVGRMRSGGKPDPGFIDTAVDFIRTYADRCHHGKEEDILFAELAKKRMSPEHKQRMDELIGEHVKGRKTVAKLVEARDRLVAGDKSAEAEITAQMQALVDFYPKHILKEDRNFFMPCMDYFTKDERDGMLGRMRDFDRKLIHEAYGKRVDSLEARYLVKQ